MRTVGVIARHEDRKVIEIAEPFGVVAAIVPSTNPTSTAIYKILISLKARCPIVISPHPSAARCITQVAEVLNAAALAAGAPEGAVNWMTHISIEGTNELMRHRDVAVILATGGMGLVRAAYSAGKPAYGVGPGNAPCYIERSADVAKAASDILTGKSFDHGVLCSSPNSVVVDAAIADEAKRQFQAQGGYFLTTAEADVLAKALVTPQRLPNPKFVGRSALHIAGGSGLLGPCRHARPDCRAERRRTRLSPLDRKALPRAFVLRRGRLAGRLRALQADPAVRRHGPHHVDSLDERSDHSRVRPEEARLPDRA